MDESKLTRDRVLREFERNFGGVPRLFRAPGRVNLIGEHTDYNEGYVLPTAIDKETIAGGRIRSDRTVAVYACEKQESVSFDLDEPGEKQRRSWVDYVEGSIRCIDEIERLPRGAEIVISSSIPIGSGLSSSAALEVSVALAMANLNEIDISSEDIAFAAQKAEHEYVGTRSGIMDQFASVFGKEGNAILIDCRSFERIFVPLNLGEASIIVCDSGVHHNLAAGEYNRRRAECDEAVAILTKHRPNIKSLRDVSEQDLDEFAGYLTETLQKRSRHVVLENARVLDAVEALRGGYLDRTGQLMYESHASLRDLYEVSSAELDFLVDSASVCGGVYGSRMTGGGFGGCTVSLVKNDSVDAFMAKILESYNAEFGFDPKVYQVWASDGACEL
jgi:galactokinase